MLPAVPRFPLILVGGSDGVSFEDPFPPFPYRIQYTFLEAIGFCDKCGTSNTQNTLHTPIEEPRRRLATAINTYMQTCSSPNSELSMTDEKTSAMQVTCSL